MTLFQRLNPFADAYLRAADGARDERDWAKAAFLYKKYLQTRPQSAPIWVQLGHALKESGDLENAERAYARALTLAPADPDCSLQMGHLLKITNRLPLAIEHYRRALELNPGHEGALIELEAVGAGTAPPFLAEISQSDYAGDLQRVTERLNTIEASIAPTLNRIPQILELTSSLRAVGFEAVRQQRMTESLVSRITELEDENRTLRVQLADGAASVLAALDANTSALHAEVEVLRAALEAQSSAVSVVAELAEADRTQQAALTRLDEKLAASADVASTQAGALSKVGRDLSTAHNILNATESRIAACEVRLGSIIASAPGDLSVNLEPRILDSEARIGRSERMLEYLVNRLEFVRREVLYEFRHGPGKDPGRNLSINPHIVDGQKFTRHVELGLRLNIGCGHIPMEGYINLDRRELPGVDIVCEAEDIPVEIGTVEEIRSSHLLEHFPQEQLVRTLLPYWVSLLRPGGRFVVIVPDGEAMICASAAGSYPFKEFREVFFGAQDYDGDFHYNMFTSSSLTEILEAAGLISVEVSASGRRNGACFEMELIARKPLT